MGIVGCCMTNFGKIELGGLQLGAEDSEFRYKRKNFTSERLAVFMLDTGYVKSTSYVKSSS